MNKPSFSTVLVFAAIVVVISIIMYSNFAIQKPKVTTPETQKGFCSKAMKTQI